MIQKLREAHEKFKTQKVMSKNDLILLNKLVGEAKESLKLIIHWFDST